ncbi:Type VI secretion lipoprotein [compost metagenome]
MELRPGETVELKLSVAQGSRYVGVLAAYRDLSDTQWRYTLQVPALSATDAELTLGENGLRNTHATLAKAAD